MFHCVEFLDFINEKYGHYDHECPRETNASIRLDRFLPLSKKVMLLCKVITGEPLWTL